MASDRVIQIAHMLLFAPFLFYVALSDRAIIGNLCDLIVVPSHLDQGLHDRVGGLAYVGDWRLAPGLRHLQGSGASDRLFAPPGDGLCRVWIPSDTPDPIRPSLEKIMNEIKKRMS